MDTAAAGHNDNDFLGVNDLVRTTSANFSPPKSWHQGIIIMDIDNWIMDIHDRTMDIHKSNYGYP